MGWKQCRNGRATRCIHDPVTCQTGMFSTRSAVPSTKGQNTSELIKGSSSWMQITGEAGLHETVLQLSDAKTKHGDVPNLTKIFRGSWSRRACHTYVHSFSLAFHRQFISNFFYYYRPSPPIYFRLVWGSAEMMLFFRCSGSVAGESFPRSKFSLLARSLYRFLFFL